MSNSHKGSLIQFANRIVPVDTDTTALFHYDITENEVLKGVNPKSGAVFTLLPSGGYYGGGIAVEESTSNLFTQPTANSAFAIKGSGQINPIYYGKDSIIYEYDYSQNMTWTYHGLSVPVTSGSTYTYSCWAYVSPDSNMSANGMCLGWEGSGGGGYTFYDYTKVGTWQYMSLTSTPTSSSNNFYLYPTASSTPATTGYMLFRDVMLENKTFRTSFVNGSRNSGILSYPNDSDIINPLQGTINFWYKPDYSSTDVTAQTNSPKLIQVGSYYANSSFTLWNYVNNFNVYVKGKTSGGWSATSSVSNGIVYGSFAMYTVSWSGTQWKVYVNGVLKTTFTASENLGSISSDIIYVGGDGGDGGGGSGKVCNGVIDELRIDRIQRTDEEIMSWYISNQPFYPKGIYRLAY